jgi:hypothetical protein
MSHKLNSFIVVLVFLLVLEPFPDFGNEDEDEED